MIIFDKCLPITIANGPFERNDYCHLHTYMYKCEGHRNIIVFNNGSWTLMVFVKIMLQSHSGNLQLPDNYWSGIETLFCQLPSSPRSINEYCSTRRRCLGHYIIVDVNLVPWLLSPCPLRPCVWNYVDINCSYLIFGRYGMNSSLEV